MRGKVFENVWDALADSPEEAAMLRMRSDVMMALADTVKSWKVTQATAARRLGITQPRLNDLLRGKIGKFSLDTLLILAKRAELRVQLEIRPAA